MFRFYFGKLWIHWEVKIDDSQKKSVKSFGKGDGGLKVVIHQGCSCIENRNLKMDTNLALLVFDHRIVVFLELGLHLAVLLLLVLLPAFAFFYFLLPLLVPVWVLYVSVVAGINVHFKVQAFERENVKIVA